MRRIWLLIAILGLSLLGQRIAPAQAEGPDYAVPGRLALPWSCGEGQRISWGPVEHWEHGKARGLAFDFAMDEGTSLYAPTNGVAYFLKDERPFETNFGNYVEVATEDGDWLIRLAHLRDGQGGERPVRAGELIGHSGGSGVPAAHLHLELLVRQGQEWVRPDVGALTRLFGWPMTGFVEGAILTNDGCAAVVSLGGPVRSMAPSTLAGETAQLAISLRNEGLERLDIDAVQLFLLHSSGQGLVLDATGPWALTAKSGLEIVVSGRPDRAGLWRIAHLVYTAGEVSHRLATSGELQVDPLPLAASDLMMEARVLGIGAPIAFTVKLQNDAEHDIAFDDLILRGTRPDETLWEASYGRPGLAPAQDAALFRLASTTVPQTVGQWRALQIGLSVNGQTVWFDELQESFAVSGPQLRVDRVGVYPSGRTLIVMLTVNNVGTGVATPDAIEVWGWKPDGDIPFGARQRSVAPIGPGAKALVLLTIPVDDTQGRWRLVEAGQWTEGSYYRMPLPYQPGISVLSQGLAASALP